MNKWEHKIKVYNRVMTIDEQDRLQSRDPIYDFQEDAENLGLQGWELVSVTMGPEGLLAAYKRQAPEAEEERANDNQG